MKAKSDIQRANEARANRRLPAVHVGFDYAMAIQRICRDAYWIDANDRRRRYKVPDVAACIGISPQAARKIINGQTVNVKHVTAQLLVGLWKDVFGDYKLKRLPMSAEQRSSQKVRK